MMYHIITATLNFCHLCPVHPQYSFESISSFVLNTRRITSVLYFQLGPNVTIGKHVTVGAGVRVRESMVLEGSVLQVGTVNPFNLPS